jgi:hypothetical protein
LWEKLESIYVSDICLAKLESQKKCKFPPRIQEFVSSFLVFFLSSVFLLLLLRFCFCSDDRAVSFPAVSFPAVSFLPSAFLP